MQPFLQWVSSPEELEALVERIGFLPLFSVGIPGFSVEDCTPRELWFVEGVDGPWEWKGPLAAGGKCMYGKFFGGKAGFISREWIADFCNLRRDGYDAEGCWEDQRMRRDDHEVLEALTAVGSLLSWQLKDRCNYRKGGNKGFDSVMTRLQMNTFACIGNFEYRIDRYGKTYGWGVARYTTPECLFGEELLEQCADSPEESGKRIRSHLLDLMPGLDERGLKLLTGVRTEA